MSAGRKVTKVVTVTDVEHGTVVLMPGDTVPAWAKDQVTNPKVFDADDEPDDVVNEGGEPASARDDAPEVEQSSTRARRGSAGS